MLSLVWMMLTTPMDLDAQVEKALSQLTLEEKIECLGGVDSMYTKPIPKLGIPRIRMSDGPAGVRCWGKSTAYPAPISVAASFNEDLMRRFGEQIAEDAKARDTQIFLGPGVNLARVPQNGRNFEYFGEDPFLAGRCAVQTITAMQKRGVAATIKHYVANDHENDRMKDTSNVDEAVLRELYLWPFEMAVKQAHVKCLMSGYNRINGTYASQHKPLIMDLLKKEWGFQGVHMSDWGGTHDGVGAALGGLDLEMPDAVHMSQQAMRDAVKQGAVPESAIDDKVRRLLRLIYEMGWDKSERKELRPSKEDPKSAEVSLEMARQGMVLLTNRKGLLPLKNAQRVALTGFFTESRVSGGGGSAYTDPFTMLTLRDALSAEFGADKVVHAPAGEEALPSIPLPPLQASYYGNRDLSGEPILTREEKQINFHYHGTEPAPGVPATNFSARWRMEFTVPETNEYLIRFAGDDGYRVKLNGKTVIEDWTDHAITKSSYAAQLEEGKKYTIEIEYFQGAGDAAAKFGITSTFKGDEEFFAPMKNADAVIATVGFAGDEGEGNDRPFDLPNDQARFLDNLFERFDNVVIVVTSGGATNLARWSDKAAAIIQAWYPGGNGNQALAEILSGKTNPSGKLPCTFPVSFEGTYYAKAYPPVKGALDYSEGLSMGYRWFDHHGAKPLFAFGHGLSYSKFAVSDVKVESHEVSATVKNTSGPAGATTVQVYIGRESDKPIYRQLKGFARVDLKPGESKTVRIPLDERAFARWDAGSKSWRVAEGAYQVQVGLASDEVASTQTVTFISAKTVK